MARIFTLRQRAGEIEVETAASTRPELHHLALFVLDVLRRDYWVVPPDWVMPPDATATGTLRWEQAGERVVQREVPDGVLRSFHRGPTEVEEAPVTIHYHDLQPDGLPTSPVRIESRWCGYRAVSVVLPAGSSALGSRVEGTPRGGSDR